MRDFGRFIKVVICVLIISLGAFAYNFISKVTLPTVNLAGSLISNVQDGFSNIGIFFSNAFSKSFEFDTIQAENAILKSQIMILEQENRATEYALIENESLKQMFGMYDDNIDFEFQIAEVVGESLSANQYILTIDKGRRAGVEVSDLVITNDGVVGVVCEVGEIYAKVRTVLDSSFSIGCIISRSRGVGILENELTYTKNGLLKLAYLDKNLDIEIGDKIETSGVSGLYPKGFLIGTVESIKIESQGVSKFATLTPFVDFSNLNQVYVIKEF